MPSGSPEVTLHSASPILETILTNWSNDRQSLRQNHDSLLDEAGLSIRELDDHRAELKNHWKDLTNFFHDEIRSAEIQARNRFQRVDEWRTGLTRIGQQLHDVEMTEFELRWFNRAQAVSDQLKENIGNRYRPVDERHEKLNADLQEWLLELVAKETQLKEFKKKASEYPRPFLVSRGRKQPELFFLERTLEKNTTLNLELLSLRKTVAIYLSRLHKIDRMLEKHSRGSDGLLSVRRHQLGENLQEVQNHLLGLREKVLADALLYESCHQKVKWIQSAVNGIKCIEDEYRGDDPLWKKWLSPILKL